MPQLERAQESTDVLSAFREHVLREEFFPKESAVLVGVSGRSDSVSLLRLLAALASELHIRLSVGHVRRDDSPEGQEDAAFVEHLASTLALPLETAPAATSLSSAQQRAPFWQIPLTEIAERQGVTVIATGETREDAAERLVSTLIGSSPTLEGLLAGAEEQFVRPLLSFSHEACVTYLTQRGFSFRVNPNALALDTVPAKIRLLVLPLLERHLYPNALEQCATISEFLAAERAFLDALASAARQELRWDLEETHIAFDRVRWMQLPPVLRLRLLIEATQTLVPDASLSRIELLRLDSEILSLPQGEQRSVGRLKVSRAGGILTLHQDPSLPHI